MKKPYLSAFAILFALVASGAAYQKFSWAQAPVKERWEAKERPEAKERAEARERAESNREEESSSRKEESTKREIEAFKRQGEEFKRQGDEFKRQAKDFKIQQKAFTLVRGPNGMDGQIKAAAEALRDADGEEAKAQATEKLKDLLDKFFEEDMGRRKEAVADLEERLQKLRAQLDRRRAKKQEIVDLQMKIVVNEADGLGFSSQPDSKDLDFNFRVPAPNVMYEVPVTTTYSAVQLGGPQPEARRDAWQSGPAPTPGTPPLTPPGSGPAPTPGAPPLTPPGPPVPVAPK